MNNIKIVYALLIGLGVLTIFNVSAEALDCSVTLTCNVDGTMLITATANGSDLDSIRLERFQYISQAKCEANDYQSSEVLVSYSYQPGQTPDYVGYWGIGCEHGKWYKAIWTVTDRNEGRCIDTSDCGICIDNPPPSNIKIITMSTIGTIALIVSLIILSGIIISKRKRKKTFRV